MHLLFQMVFFNSSKFIILKEPTLDEGFSEIVTVNFIPNFENEDHRKIYEMHLTES